MINFETFFKIDKDNRFGFFIENNKINFLVPPILEKEILFTSNIFNNMKILKKYIKVLKKYENSRVNNNKLNFESVKNDKNIDCIEAMINLIEDLFQNGDYFYKSNHLKKSQEKIDWNKTIKKNEIIVKPTHIKSNFKSNENVDLSVIYGSFVSKYNNYNEKDLFFQIYKITISKILYLFYGVKEKNECNIPEKMYLTIINKFLNSHFKDREIFIAKQLKTIYEQNNYNKSFENNFELKYHERFEYIFEYMIENTIKNISIKDSIKIKKQGNYIIYGEKEKEYAGLNLKMDHIVYTKGYYKILDSKFYNIDLEKPNLPKTPDIIKQIGYKFILSDFLKEKNININNIFNLFIFPTINETEIFGEHNMNNNDLFEISCIKVNIFFLMENFSKNKEYKDFINKL